MKKLAVFFDGTWNRADQKSSEGKACPTNITKLFEATLPADEEGNPQIVHYVRGVGTRWSERLRGGGFGYGISNNIKEGYRFLVSNYESGDAVYIFGFSRGAYTARSLAGMIRNVGILKREKLHRLNEAYRHYRDKSPQWHPDADASIDFRQEYTWKNEEIHFLGVFDTVGALGAPFGIIIGWIIDKIFRCSFHDTQLSSIVKNAYHCLAVDEKRLPFMPTLMSPNKNHNTSENYAQEWFPGVHSNVGGGYAKTGLSDLALKWMADHARRHSLNINVENATIPSPFQPDVTEIQEESQTVMYRIATILFVKLPSCIGFVPQKYKTALPNIKWNGDYIRPIPGKGNVAPFLGNPPAQNTTDYQGSLNSSVIDKINRCRPQYHPQSIVNIADEGV